MPFITGQEAIETTNKYRAAKMDSGYRKVEIDAWRDSQQGSCRDNDFHEKDEDGRLPEVQTMLPDVKLNDMHDITKDVTHKQTDEVQEGWYSWLVLLASVGCMSLSVSGVFTFPVLFVEWQEAFQASTASIALAGSIQGTISHGFSEYSMYQPTL